MGDAISDYLKEATELLVSRAGGLSGRDFLQATARFIARSIGADVVSVATVQKGDDGMPAMASTAALLVDGTFLENVRYSLAGSPCGKVVETSLCCYPEGIQDLFPDDRMLHDMGVTGFIGVPLFSSKGQQLGLIAAGTRTALHDVETAKTLMRMIAISAAAELERDSVLRALAESEKRFLDFADSASDWFWEMDADLRFCYLSDRFETVTGISPDKLLGKTRREVRFPGASREELEKLLDDLDNRRPFRDFIHTTKKPDGSTAWFTSTGRPIIDRNGQFAGFRGTGRDITQLVDERNKLRAIFDNAPVEIYLKDREGRYLQINNQFERLFNVRNEDLVGKFPVDAHDPDLAARSRAHDLEVLHTGKPVIRDEEAQTKDGVKYLHTVKFPVYDDRNNLTGLGAIVSDITAIKLAEKAVTEAEELFRTCFENLTVGSIVIDTAGTVCMFNSSAEKMFGYQRQEVIGRNVRMLMPEPFHSHHNDYLSHYERTGEAHVIGSGREALALKKSGKNFPIHLGVGILRTRDEKHFIAAITDLSELKQTQSSLQEALAEAERANRTKSEFLAMMSHEFRTPLNAILGFSDMLRNRDVLGVTTEKEQEYSASIFNSGKLLLSLVNDILDIAAIEAGKRDIRKAVIDLSEILKSCATDFQPIASAAEVSIILSGTESPHSIVGDERSIRQIVVNLLSNAIKFSQSGGSVRLAVEESRYSVDLIVEDQGDGIPEDKVAEIMKPFVQVNTNPHVAHEGTGLGLSIVEMLVREHDAEIKVDSTLGVGTKMTVTFPL